MGIRTELVRSIKLDAGSKVSIVGSHTVTTGRIESEDVLIVAGQVNGDIRSQKVVIKAAGRVNGNITCKSLVIEPGGVFDGRAFMTDRRTGGAGEPETT